MHIKYISKYKNCSNYSLNAHDFVDIYLERCMRSQGYLEF